MPRVKLFIACSFDGFIARNDGSVDWLFTDNDYGYTEFYNSIDALIMGRKTYEQVLSFGEWPYKGKRSYVFTSQKFETELRNVEFVSGDPSGVLRDIFHENAHDIWLVGGAELISAFLSKGLIDEYIVSIHPILLGQGIPLFSAPGPEESLRLIGCKSYPDGLVQLHYGDKEI